MNISEVLTVSVRKFWKFKVFWLLGGLAVIVMAFYLLVSQLISLPYGQSLFADFLGVTEEWMFSLLNLTLYFAFSLASFPLLITGMLGIITGVLRAEHEPAEELHFMKLLRAGLPFFWRALGVRLIFVLVPLILIVPLVILVSILAIFTFGLGLLCLLPLLLLFIPVSYTVYGLMELSETAVVAEDLPVFAAISRSWALFKANVWKVLLMALLIYLGIGLLGTIFVLPFTLPGYLPLFSDLMPSQLSERDFFLLSIALSCVALPFYTLAQGIILALQKTAWVETYLAMSRAPAQLPALEVFDVGETA